MANQSTEEILKAVDGGNPDLLSQAISALKAKGEEVVGPLLKTLGGTGQLRRWVAAAVLGEVGDDRAIPSLKKALDDRSLSIRLRSALSLAKLGSQAGVPALLAALDSEEVIIGHPPELAGDFADQALRAISGQDFGYGDDPAGTPAAIESWRKWWAETGDSFQIEK